MLSESLNRLRRTDGDCWRGARTVEAIRLQVEKMREFLIKFLFWTVILGLAYVLLKYAMPFLTPFLTAFFIAFLLKPVTNWITQKTRLKRRTVAVLLLVAFYVLIGSLFTVLGTRIVIFLRDAVYAAPRVYAGVIRPALETLQRTLEGWVATLSPALTEFVVNLGDHLSDALSEIVSAVSGWALGRVTNAAGSVPAFLVKFLMTIVASFFFVADYYEITSFLARQLSPKARGMLFTIKQKCVEVLCSFGRAYAILMSITFAEVFLGLALLRVDYALLIALITAIVDILPVLGTGTVLIPWGVAMLILGNFPLGVGLLILYGVITVVRQMLEPRIVGQQIGLYPLVTLLCMFAGTYLFGFVGLFGVPIVVTLLVQLNRSGEIQLFR